MAQANQDTSPDYGPHEEAICDTDARMYGRPTPTGIEADAA